MGIPCMDCNKRRTRVTKTLYLYLFTKISPITHPSKNKDGVVQKNSYSLYEVRVQKNKACLFVVGFYFIKFKFATPMNTGQPPVIVRELLSQSRCEAVNFFVSPSCYTF